MKPENEKPTLQSGDTRYIGRRSDSAYAQAADSQGRSDENEIIPWVVEFRVIGTSSVIRSPIKETMLIGRLDPHSENYPEIDMGLYNGQHLGVSRRHARLSARDNRVTIEDLGSANGTYINDKLLVEHQPYRLREGDRITLGKIELQVHFVVKPYATDDTQLGLGNAVPVVRVGNKQRLLVVDDNPDVCQIIRMVVTRAGFRASIAQSASQGLARVDDNQVDGLIVEMALGQGTGADVIQYLRMKNPEAPILAMAEVGGAYSEAQALDAGADLFLTKPIAVDELSKALTKMAKRLPQLPTR